MQPGEWHGYRRDAGLSGRCPLAGRITEPAVRWRRYLGGSGNECFTVRASGTARDLVVAYGGCLVRLDAAGGTVWKTACHGLSAISLVEELDGDGVEEIVATTGHEVFAFSAADGALLWRAWVGFPDSIGAPPTILLAHRFDRNSAGRHLVVPLFSSQQVLLFDFRGGARRVPPPLVLRMDDAFHPTVAAADLDGDGTDEVVVTKRGAVYAFDPFTGRMKSTVAWRSDAERRRNYGLLHLADLDGDGAVEIVVASDRVSRHLSVVDNDGRGNLSVRWDRFIQHIYPHDTTELRYTFNSVRDVDGDGLPEIALSLWNTRGDGRWWLEIVDPLSGSTRYEAPDRYLCGVQDVDGDGAHELFVAHAPARLPDAFSPVEILKVEGGALRTAWAHPRARFAPRSVRPSGGTAHLRPQIHGQDEVWAEPSPEGGRVFLFEPAPDAPERAGALVELALGARPAARARIAVAAAAAPVLVGLEDLEGRGERARILSDERGLLTAYRPDGSPIVRHALGFRLPTEGYSAPRPAPTPVVFTAPGEPAPLLALHDNAGALHLLESAGPAAPPRLRWTRPGRGRIGYDGAYHAASVADVDRDGRPELLAALPAAEGGSEIVAFDLAGNRKAAWLVPGAPAPRLGTRLGAYDWLWLEGGPEGPRLVASFYRSPSMNSEESVCLDADGRVRWRRETAAYADDEEGRGFGPWGCFSARPSPQRQGYELFFLAKDLFCQVDAETGDRLRPPWPLWLATKETMDPAWTRAREETFGTIDDPFTAYGSVILADVDGDGEEELVVGGCFGGMGVLRADHSVLWWKRTPFTDVLLRLPGVGDARGDGSRCVGIGHTDGRFACYDGVTGEEAWSLPLGAVTTDVVTADVDGDGRDEFVAGTTDGRLLALGAGPDGRGRVVWSLDLGFTPGSPVVADADGDGLPEILVVGGDGFVYCVG